MSVFLYVLMIFAWGFSWIAIKWQDASVAMEVSILYRFALAALCMFAIGLISKKLQKVTLAQHKFIAAQGVCLFCCNFLAFYSATHYIPSGLAAVVMASVPVFNALHGKLFYQTPTSANFWLGVLVGLSGICLLFGGELIQTAWSLQTLTGLGFALAGTWCFSIGNMLSIRNSRNNVQPFTATSYAMLYGCLALLLIILFKGLEFKLNTELKYFASLVYLAVPASVIGFTGYLVLVDRIGANNASYLLVITPIVALIVSSFYESYQWTHYSTMGLVLVVLGNLLSQWKKPLLSSGGAVAQS
ncbi:MAG: membrane protein, putative [Osedax symbiont Rs2]|nr:MAG: membrane protein, putative [Osedax symbiont Rs2]